MEFELRIKTPGAHLSMSTLFGVTSDLTKLLELSVIDALVDAFPTKSKSTIGKLVKHRIRLELSDANKGSWELVMIGAAGSAIGGAVTVLATDLVTGSDQWKKFKEKVYSISERSADNAKSRIERKNSFGTFKTEKKNVAVRKIDNVIPRLELDSELCRRKDIVDSTSLKEQVNDLIKQLENRNSETK